MRRAAMSLAFVPLVLMVPKSSAIRDAAEFLRQKKITQPLTGLPSQAASPARWTGTMSPRLR